MKVIKTGFLLGMGVILAVSCCALAQVVGVILLELIGR